VPSRRAAGLRPDVADRESGSPRDCARADAKTKQIERGTARRAMRKTWAGRIAADTSNADARPLLKPCRWLLNVTLRVVTELCSQLMPNRTVSAQQSQLRRARHS